MRGSSAASISSSSSSKTVDSSDPQSLNKLIALKSHYTELDERRRNAASLRLFGKIDGAVSYATSDKPEFGSSDYVEFPEFSVKKGLESSDNVSLDNAVKDHNLDVATEKKRDFRQNVSDIVVILENAIKDTDENRVFKPKAWTTDDIQHSNSGEVCCSSTSC